MEIEKNKDESTLRTYILNTSFHGFRYLGERERHWSEKIFWLICCILSWIGTGMLLYANYDDYQNNAIQFVTETTYLDWNTDFPSIIICETDNQDKIAEVTDEIYGDPHDYNLDEIVKELVYYRGLSFYTLQMCGPESPDIVKECDMKNFTIFSKLVRTTCEEFLKNCKWNDEEFNCCDYFTPIDTEMGTCYSINSKQARSKKFKKYPMISNRNTGPGTFYFQVYGFSSNIYILGEQEVPSLTTLQTDILQTTPHLSYHRYIGITEIENQPEVKDVGILQRNCRFMDENNLEVYKSYSYSACCVQCRKDAQMEKCNCTHHLMPETSPNDHCNLEGLNCLSENYNNLAVLKPEWSGRPGLVCHCIPSCTEVEMTVIKDDKIGITEDFAVVRLTLDHLPTERFKRNVVKGKLDLVVSMGGTTALFIGASILSLVEVLYYFVLRPLSNFFIKRRDENSGNRIIQLKTVKEVKPGFNSMK